ncbi:MAG TPA: PilW family protein, partial [Aquabacterium sp.]|nr:PilW family protein [Aquabacterium sp.]
TQIKYTLDGGRSILTFGLGCQGNAAATYQSLVPGIEQLRIRYGLRDASAPRATQYVDANAAGAAGAITVDDQTYQGWQRVVSVQVCLVARSLTATRFRGAGAETRLDCDDNTLPNDGVQRRRFIQVFALKNKLS